MQITPRILLAAPAALVLIACGATEPNAMHPVNLAAAIAGGAPTGGGSTSNLIVGDQRGSVSISSAQMVLSRIELASSQSCTGGSSPINASNQDDDEPSDSSDADNDDGESSDSSDVDDDDGESSDSSDVDNDDGESSDSSDVDNDDGESSDSSDVDDDDGESSDSSDVDDDDGESSDSSDADNPSPSASNNCVPLETGQVLVNLPLDGATKGFADGWVPAGTYTRLRANLQTVKVVGVYTDANGTAHQFTLTRRLNVVSAIRLNTPVTVDASTLNLILDVGVRSWFTDRTGAVFDPTSAANQSMVQRNILRSLRARS
jgi:hypothetical protein